MDKELNAILKSSTLLLVEDHEISYSISEKIFNRYVKKIIRASNGKEALEKYKKYKPSFIVTDIEMPEMNGLEFIDILRKENEEIPVIVMSGFSNKEYLLFSIKLHLSDYIIKPINHEIVTASLEKVARTLRKNSLPFVIEIKDGVLYRPLERIICVDNIVNRLTIQECDLIDLLLLHRGNTVTKLMVEDKLYHFKEMGDSALKNIVYKLRKKLKKEVIISVERIGYKIE